MSDLLEQRLAELAQHLDVRADRLVTEVLGRLDDPSPSRLRYARRIRARRLSGGIGLAVATVIVAVVIAVLVVPGTRHSVAHWFGIGSTKIEQEPPPTTTGDRSRVTASSDTAPIPTSPVTFPAQLDLGDPTSPADASARTGLPVPVAASLGAASGIYVVSPPVTGQITVVYPPSDVIPQSPVPGIGALLSTMPGTIDGGFFAKVAGAGTTVESFTFDTAAGTPVHAVFLSGTPHDYVFQDRDGTIQYDTLRLATNTLLWQDGDVTYRLEAAVTRARAVAIASSVTADDHGTGTASVVSGPP